MAIPAGAAPASRPGQGRILAGGTRDRVLDLFTYSVVNAVQCPAPLSLRVDLCYPARRTSTAVGCGGENRTHLPWLMRPGGSPDPSPHWSGTRVPPPRPPRWQRGALLLS